MRFRERKPSHGMGWDPCWTIILIYNWWIHLDTYKYIISVDQVDGWICGNKGKEESPQGLRELRVSQCLERVPTKPLMCTDSPWASNHCQLRYTLETRGIVGMEWQWERKGALSPHRHGQSDLFTLGPSDHTGELQIFRCLEGTRVRPQKGWKEKGRGGMILPKGKRGNPSPFGARVVQFPLDPYLAVGSAAGGQFPKEY